MKDSVLQKYFNVVESTDQADTSDINYKALKAYISDDTNYLRKLNSDIDNFLKYKQTWIGDSCVHQTKLRDLNADEAYRFVYSGAFCPYKLNVTVTNKNDSSKLHFILYKIDDDTIPCRIVSEYDKALTRKDWQDVREAINKADFWGLKRNNGVEGLDGGTLVVTGFTKGFNTGAQTPKTNYVYRWGSTTLDDPFHLLLKLSGNTQGCIVIK